MLKTNIFFRPELRIYEDTYFFLEISKYAEFIALDKVLIQRRRHSAHTSTGKNAYFQLMAMLQLYRDPEIAARISVKAANMRFAKQYFETVAQLPEKKKFT